MCCSHKGVAMRFKEDTSHSVRQDVSMESPSISQTAQVIGQEAGQGSRMQQHMTLPIQGQLMARVKLY